MKLSDSAKLATLRGTFGGCVTYGVLLLLYYQCMRLLVLSKEKTRTVWLQMIYCTAIVVCATVGMGYYIEFLETQMFSSQTIGPLISSLPPACFGTYMITMWLADGILLYRFYFIWGWKLYLVVPSFILYIATIVLSSIGFSLLIRGITGPDLAWKHVWSSAWAISAGFNTLLTAAITGRLLHLNWRIRRATGHAVSNIYTTFSSLIVESAVFSTVPAMTIFLVCALAPSAVPKVMPSFGNSAAISPILIQYWVAKNRSVSPRVIASMTQAAFGPTSQKPPLVDIVRHNSNRSDTSTTKMLDSSSHV